MEQDKEAIKAQIEEESQNLSSKMEKDKHDLKKEKETLAQRIERENQELKEKMRKDAEERAQRYRMIFF